MEIFTEHCKTFMGHLICQNYGGWVVVESGDFNIYKTRESAKRAIRKMHGLPIKMEPMVVGTMSLDQYLNAFRL